ncbi:MAG: hypothetical protein ACI8R4_004223, partial [Paracoccaceae bacterium]
MVRRPVIGAVKNLFVTSWLVLRVGFGNCLNKIGSWLDENAARYCNLMSGNFICNSIGEYPKLCVWGLAHAVKTGHLLNRSGYKIANW